MTHSSDTWLPLFDAFLYILFCFPLLSSPWVLSPGISGPLWSHLFKEGRSTLRFPSPRVVPWLDLIPVPLPCPTPTFVLLCRAGNFENSHVRQLCCDLHLPLMVLTCVSTGRYSFALPAWGIGSDLDDSVHTPPAILLYRSAFSCFCFVLTKKVFFLELLLEEIIGNVCCFESGSRTLGCSGT